MKPGAIAKDTRNTMLDLKGDRTTGWPLELMPIGEGEVFDKEPFADWWPRCRDHLPGLSPLAAEQWIHRHWSNSPYYGVALRGLVSRAEDWSSADILSEVYIGEELHPEWTYSNLRTAHTGRTMIERGTWDYPLLIMSTPAGFEDWSGPHADHRYCLIEGHQRYRFLNAMVARGQGHGSHQVLVLNYDQAGARSSATDGSWDALRDMRQLLQDGPGSSHDRGNLPPWASIDCLRLPASVTRMN